VIEHIGDVEIALTVETNLVRLVELGRQGRAAVAGGTGGAGARDTMEEAGTIDPTDEVPPVLTEVEVTFRTACDAERVVQEGRNCWAAVSLIPALAGPGEVLDVVN
jgi:hypothetical protein